MYQPDLRNVFHTEVYCMAYGNVMAVLVYSNYVPVFLTDTFYSWSILSLLISVPFFYCWNFSNSIVVVTALYIFNLAKNDQSQSVL
jgi:hypothetical protein